MTWRDRLVDASFAGVPFKVSTSEYEAGRRIHQENKYKNVTTTKDLGPITNIYTLNAYIIQNNNNEFDYFDERNDLINALNKYRKDGAELFHPFFRQKVYDPDLQGA